MDKHAWTKVFPYTPEGREEAIEFVRNKRGLYPDEGRLYYIRSIKRKLRKKVLWGDRSKEEIAKYKFILRLAYGVLREKLSLNEAYKRMQRHFAKEIEEYEYGKWNPMTTFWRHIQFGIARQPLITQIGGQDVVTHEWTLPK